MVSLACEPKECKLIKQAMVLAAGLGTRLRPITYYTPKPLFPILNTPILKLILEGPLKEFSKVIINSYHLSDQIALFIKNLYPHNSHILLIKEPHLLGTGGALKNALSFMDQDSPILVYNADIITDFNPSLLYNFHLNISRKYKAIATLLLHDHNAFNNIKCNTCNLYEDITAFRIKSKNSLAYTGIMVIEPRFIKSFIKNKPCDIIDIFSKALMYGKKIIGIKISKLVNHYIWEDIGTIRGYLNAHKLLLKSKNKKFYIPHELDIKRYRLTLLDWVCIGDNVLFKNTHPIIIKHSVIWSNTKIDNSFTYINNMIITDKGILELK